MCFWPASPLALPGGGEAALDNSTLGRAEGVTQIAVAEALLRRGEADGGGVLANEFDMEILAATDGGAGPLESVSAGERKATGEG